jgi:mRNA interferase RelE/StbE
MGRYKIEWKSSAVKELKVIPKPMLLKILSAVEFLMDNPHPAGCKKLIGTESIYRIRVGNYRIVYYVEQFRLVVQVIKVGHRKDVYKKT